MVLKRTSNHSYYISGDPCYRAYLGRYNQNGGPCPSPIRLASKSIREATRLTISMIIEHPSTVASPAENYSLPLHWESNGPSLVPSSPAPKLPEFSVPNFDGKALATPTPAHQVGPHKLDVSFP